MEEYPVIEEEESNDRGSVVDLASQQALQRQEEQIMALAHGETREILSKLQEMSFDFDKIASAVQKIHSQCLVSSGYPEIQHGVLGSVDTEVGIIQRKKDSFSRQLSHFRTVVVGVNHADSETREKSLQHASSMAAFLNRDIINRICFNLPNAIMDYQYDEIRTIAESAKVLHEEMETFKANSGDVPIDLAMSRPNFPRVNNFSL